MTAIWIRHGSGSWFLQPVLCVGVCRSHTVLSAWIPLATSRRDTAPFKGGCLLPWPEGAWGISWQQISGGPSRVSSGIPFPFHSHIPHCVKPTRGATFLYLTQTHFQNIFVVLACRMSEMKNFTIFLWHREAFLQLPFKSEIPSLNQFIPWPSQSFHSNALPSLIFPGWCRIPTLPSTA